MRPRPALADLRPYEPGKPAAEVRRELGVDRMSYAIAARVEFPATEKLRLLEERSERARLTVIVELLARGLENLAAAAEIRERAHTNGKVAPPGGETT